MHDAEHAIEKAEGSVHGGPADIPAMLANRVGDRAGVGAIFGDPVEREGVTVIPVGRVRWGFGGGGGQAGVGEGEGQGAGGGGGAVGTPVGFIEIAGGTAHYRRIGFPLSPPAIIAGAVAVFLVLKGLRPFLR